MRKMSPTRRWLVLAAGVACLAGFAPRLLAGEDEEARLVVQVRAEETGDPIAGAVVYVKFKEDRFLRKDKKLEWSTKTNDEGKAVFPPMPEGQVLVQVVAKGWKTYGHFHTLEGPKQVLEIKLKPPKKWF